MTDNATEFLKDHIADMDASEKHFADVMRRTPVAESKAPPTPSRSGVQVRKSTPEDDADRAAAALANHND